MNGAVVSEATYRATRDLFEFEPLEPVTAKGKAAPLPLWHVKAARRRFGVDVEPVARTPLIGRDDDLALLQSPYARTLREFSTQLVTIAGEPGVGKTRLTAEFRRWVDDQPEIVFWRKGARSRTAKESRTGRWERWSKPKPGFWNPTRPRTRARSSRSPSAK